MKKVLPALLLTAALSLSLTGCGDEVKEAANDKVTSGKRAGEAVDGLNQITREQSDEVDKYLD